MTEHKGSLFFFFLNSLSSWLGGVDFQLFPSQTQFDAATPCRWARFLPPVQTAASAAPESAASLPPPCYATLTLTEAKGHTLHRRALRRKPETEG